MLRIVLCCDAFRIRGTDETAKLTNAVKHELIYAAAAAAAAARLHTDVPISTKSSAMCLVSLESSRLALQARLLLIC